MENDPRYPNADKYPDRDKYLDKVGECFGWCKIEPIDWNSSAKFQMCSCKCSSWGASGMANTPPYNHAFTDMKLVCRTKAEKRANHKNKGKVIEVAKKKKGGKKKGCK
jgi:hypothetical protein